LPIISNVASWPTEDDPHHGLRSPPVRTVTAKLTACFALVRPVGMSAGEATDWLTVAAEEVRDIPADLLDEALLAVRRSCTHHGQIIPTVFKAIGDRLDARQRRQSELLRREADAHPFNPLADQQAQARHLTQDEIDDIVEERGMRMSVARDAGWIAWDVEGKCYVPGKPKPL
jgi:hypothetical protein